MVLLKSWKVIKDCLESFRLTGPSIQYEVIVVDYCLKMMAWKILPASLLTANQQLQADHSPHIWMLGNLSLWLDKFGVKI